MTTECQALGMTRLRVALLVGAMVLGGCADESARPVLGPPAGAPVTGVSDVGGAPAGTQALASGGSSSVAAGPITSLDPRAGLVPLDGFESAILRVVNGPDEAFYPVLYAWTLEARRQGLMGVTDFLGWTGMAFVFEADTEAAFWMRNTPMPLSIVFLRADGAVVSIVDMEPCADVDSCPTYPPAGPYRFAIEVPQGRVMSLGIGQTSFIGLE